MGLLDWVRGRPAEIQADRVEAGSGGEAVPGDAGDLAAAGMPEEPGTSTATTPDEEAPPHQGTTDI